MKPGKWCRLGLRSILLLVLCHHLAWANDVTYSYDVLGRLTQAVTSDASTQTIINHAYDSTGNITQTTVASSIVDTDNDGMPDGWEQSNGLNPNNPADAQLDLDNDGLLNRDEYGAGTNPANVDSDGDGASDGEEIAAGTNPLDPSSSPSVDEDVPMMGDLSLALFALVLLGLGCRALRGSRALLIALFLLASPHTVLVQHFLVPSTDDNQQVVFQKYMRVIQCVMP